MSTTYSHVITQKVNNGEEETSCEITLTGDGKFGRKIAVPAVTTDKAVDLTLDVSKIQSIYIKSDQDLTLETNSASAPDDTINLVANKPYVWYVGCYLTNLLDTDITALYVTNAGDAAALLTIECIFDSTP